MKYVYIIVLNWNGWKDTVNCINSLSKLDSKNYKIIIKEKQLNDYLKNI